MSRDIEEFEKLLNDSTIAWGLANNIPPGHLLSWAYQLGFESPDGFIDWAQSQGADVVESIEKLFDKAREDDLEVANVVDLLGKLGMSIQEGVDRLYNPEKFRNRNVIEVSWQLRPNESVMGVVLRRSNGMVVFRKPDGAVTSGSALLIGHDRVDNITDRGPSLTWEK